jgi:hypothetical protein
MIGYPYHSGEQIKFAQTQKNEFVILNIVKNLEAASRPHTRRRRCFTSFMHDKKIVAMTNNTSRKRDNLIHTRHTGF